MQILGIFLIGSYICRREKSHILRLSGNEMKKFLRSRFSRDWLYIDTKKAASL